MSVYTVVSEEQLTHFLANYDLGRLIRYSGITAGVENTNYFVTTSSGEFVLTLIEHISEQRLQFVLAFMNTLASVNVPCARPAPQKNGRFFSKLNQKPALLIERLSGRPVISPPLEQCHRIGKTLSSLHQAGRAFPPQYPENILAWCTDKTARLASRLTASQNHLLKEALQVAEKLDWNSLTVGVIHADLFPDNTLFEGSSLSGIIDFYHACTTPLLYDLAVTLNAWSYSEQNNLLNNDKSDTLLTAYRQQCPINENELQMLPAMRILAATRFWLSRLEAKRFPPDGDAVTQKAPESMEQLARQLITLA